MATTSAAAATETVSVVESLSIPVSPLSKFDFTVPQAWSQAWLQWQKGFERFMSMSGQNMKPGEEKKSTSLCTYVLGEEVEEVMRNRWHLIPAKNHRFVTNDFEYHPSKFEPVTSALSDGSTPTNNLADRESDSENVLTDDNVVNHRFSRGFANGDSARGNLETSVIFPGDFFTHSGNSNTSRWCQHRNLQDGDPEEDIFLMIFPSRDHLIFR
nr:unnamed protein product [Callosobruchus analis]